MRKTNRSDLRTRYTFFMNEGRFTEARLTLEQLALTVLLEETKWDDMESLGEIFDY